MAKSRDWPSIWPIVRAVIAEGDTYVYGPEMTEAEARAAWLLPGSDRRFTYIAEIEGEAVATAYLKPNMIGLGDHVSNAGWMVAPEWSGRGLGRRFAEYVIDQARELGFEAMQFNAVVSTNQRAIHLWESMGFEIVGTVPSAFRHKREGPVPVHVMYREL